MSKWKVEQLLKTAKWCEENSSGIYRESAIAADMLREYAAHRAAQAEWPSEEDAKKAARVYAKECGVPLDGVLGPMRAALQSVRPPVGVVSGKFSNQDEWTVVDCSGCGRCVAFVKKDASRHATMLPATPSPAMAIDAPDSKR